jgi:hypothetical protein
MNRHVVPTRAPAMAHIAGMPREIADQLEALWREYRRASLRSGSAPGSTPGDEPGGTVS